METKMRGVAAAAILVGTLAGASAAAAQEARETSRIYSFPKPPPEFRPLAASGEDLAKYGLPPRPGAAGRNGLPLATWTRAMTAAKLAVTPQVMRTGRQHMRAIVVKATNTHQSGTISSTNWAGQAIISQVGAFGGGSYAEVIGEWQIPAVQQAIGRCGGTDVMSMWVGIDGAGASNDVMQAGAEQDVYCSGGYNQPSYYAWFEWYPDYEYEITNFPVAPGETLLVVVQATSATTANATFVDVQSNQYTVIGFSAPAGTRLTGDSAEWILERPSINKSLGTLADFGTAWMNSEAAFLYGQSNSGTYDVAGGGGPGRVPYRLNMVDSNDNPLADAFPQGPSAQYLTVTGSAY